MKALLGRKIGMSRMFSPEGEAVAVTLISAEPNAVLLRRRTDKDGYAAIQLGLPKGSKKLFAARREFPVEIDEKVTQVGVEQFTVGEVVKVAGISKGKGFQGVVKRHGFKGGPKSHGHRHVLRAPGSIGSAFPQHVRKGMRMGGRMGSDRVTVKNLAVVWIDAEKHLLAVTGAVPGSRGSIIEIVSNE